MHNSLTLKRQGYLLTNKYIHYICADKINAMIKTNLFLLLFVLLAGTSCNRQQHFISDDTFRAEVARRVLETFGPVIVNDISAGEMDPAIVDVVAEYDAPYIAMHMRGTPATMQGMTSYRDVVEEVVSYFRLRAEQLRRCGVRRLIFDPGFGFAKTLEQNYDLLRGLHNLCSLGYPVLAGVSRKSMIYKVLDTTPDRALAGTIALGWECLRQGAAILRVHDVREAVDTVRIFKAFRP